MSQRISLREPVWWHLFALVALSAGYEALFLDYSNGELFDEGWPLNAVMQLRAGGQLYRDAFFTFPPGHLWPAWLAYAWDPPGIWLARLFYGAFNVALIVALYLLGCRLMPTRFAFWGALAVALAAPHSHLGHLLFGYRYLVFSTLALLALARALDDRQARWLFVAGLWTGVALVFRLTPAFSVACGVAVALLVAPSTWSERIRQAGLYALGIVLVSAPVLLWFAQGVGLDVVWREAVVRVIGLQSLQSLAVPTLALPEWTDRNAVHNWFVGIEYWGFSLLYAGYGVLGLIRWGRGKRPETARFALLCAVVVWGAVFFFRTVGRSDEHHLNSALPPAVLLTAHAGSVLFARLFAKVPTADLVRRRIETAACAAALIAWLFVQGFDRNFDLFDRGLVPMRTPYASQAVKPTIEVLELERLIGHIRQNAAPGDRILDLSASPLLYVLSDRLSVGEFDIFMPGTFLDDAEEARFVERLKATPPAVVVWPGWPFDSAPERAVQRTAPRVSRWVRNHYEPLERKTRRNRFILLVPLEETTGESAEAADLPR